MGRWPAIFPQAKDAPIVQENFYRFYPALCRQVTYILGDNGLAEDIAQEAFIRLYQSPPKDMRTVGGWLFQVAKNLALNLVRSETHQG
ncbi:MAG: sigma factor [Bacillota bacterium]